MPTSLAIGFPWGRYHATPWGHHVNEAAIEWPPSPWRILRALYATWQSRAPHLDEPTVHRLLDALATPPAYDLPIFVEGHTRHYLPPDNFPRSNRAKALDTFVAFEPDAELVVTWPVDLDLPERRALGEIAALLPYLGRAEAICTARVLDQPQLRTGTRSSPIHDQQAAASGTPRIRLLTPNRPLDLATLTTRTSQVRKARRIDPPGTYRATYTRPEPARPLPPPHRPRRRSLPTAVKLAVTGPALPSVQAAVGLGDALRIACMACFGSLFDRGVSPILAGKDAAGTPLTGHRHAHYLAVDEDGDHLLDHLVLWAPAGLGPAELRAIDKLHTRPLNVGYAPDLRPVRLGVEAVGEVAEVAPRLIGPARAWTSHTPFAPPRHPKRRQPWTDFVEAEVRHEMALRGLSEPSAIGHLSGAWLAFRRHRLRERLEQGRRATGLALRFDTPVRGPLALGALSHYGLGLFLPNPK